MPVRIGIRDEGSRCRTLQSAGHSCRRNWKCKIIGLHPEVAHAGHSGRRRARYHPARHPQPSGHPARGRSRSRQVSWLAGHRTCSAFPGQTQWLDRASPRRLQLRGQLRHCAARHGPHAPDSRLSFRRESEEPRTLDMVDEVKVSSTTMRGLRQIRWGCHRSPFHLQHACTRVDDCANQDRRLHGDGSRLAFWAGFDIKHYHEEAFRPVAPPIRASAGEATAHLDRNGVRFEVSIHASVGEATPLHAHRCGAGIVSIHASAGEATAGPWRP